MMYEYLKKHNILNGAARLVVASMMSATLLTGCGENPSVLDIRNEIIKEQQKEEEVQKVQEEYQRQYLDGTQSIPEKAGDAVKEGTAVFSEKTRTYTDAAKYYAGEAAENAKDAARDAQNAAGEAADVAKDKTSETAEGIKDAGRNAAENAKEAGEATVTDTKDTLTDLADGIGDQLEDLKQTLLTPTSEYGNGTSKNTEDTKSTGTYTGRVLNADTATESSNPPLKAEDIPSYTGSAYININGGKPFFTSSQLTTKDYARFSTYDSLGRAGSAQMCTSRAMMPKEEREGIGMIKPSGWKQAKYDILKDEGNPAGYLFNRAHLLAFCLGGGNGEHPTNFITGTRYFNVDAMLPNENRVLEYIANSNTGNHVLYRVTPYYTGDNLIADGVLMEAQSVEDTKLSFCVFAYNVQPGIGIDYRTGDSWVV